MSNDSIVATGGTVLSKVISGGQTGADLAALVAAQAVGLETGGTAPERYMTENGESPQLGRAYGLVAEGTYSSRTKKNVDDADATLVLLVHDGQGGSARTIGSVCRGDGREDPKCGGPSSIHRFHARVLPWRPSI